MNDTHSVIAVCGATASGKSDLALCLAKQLNGEIICMDSMQIYRGLNIGTAKPSDRERAAVPHHMLDIVEPNESYTVADYAETASRVVLEIQQRNRLPILVGGTGLYLRAMMYGLTLGGTHADPQLREQLQAIAQTENGKQRLHDMLRAVDPDSAERLHPNDTRRVIRAIEVYKLTGQAINCAEEPKSESANRYCVMAIDMPRSCLYKRINLRVEGMIQQGLQAEAKTLYDSMNTDAQSMQAIGYKEWIPFFERKCTLEEVKDRIATNTRHYAKRQLTFFHAEPSVHWLPWDDHLKENAAKQVLLFLEGESTK